MVEYKVLLEIQVLRVLQAILDPLDGLVGQVIQAPQE